MRAIQTAVVVLLVILFPALAIASVWTDVAPAGSGTSGKPYPLRLLEADPDLIRQQLLAASSALARSAGANAATIELPVPDGGMRRYRIKESPVMAAELAAKFPDFKTFKIFAIDQPSLSGRLSITPLGFHAYIDTEQDTLLIDPVRGSNAKQYSAYYKRDFAAAMSAGMKPFRCTVQDDSTLAANDQGLVYKSALDPTAAKTQNAIRNYRLAIATTGEYSQAVANGNVSRTLAEIVTAITRVNQIYERDLGTHLELVANNDQIIFTNPQTDGYTNNNDTALLDENQVKLDSVIGSGNYDIGHVFSTGGGGLASKGVVCDNQGKARGETGSSSPTGDPFYIDYVAHEIGHQFNADHSFNGTTASCGNFNRWALTAYEPGSGSTVMSYAGICGGENIVNSADAVFHAGSIAEIVGYTRSGPGATCARSGANAGNAAPVVDAGNDYIIPGGTYFELSGSANDPESDSLVFHWDEMDTGVATSVTTIGLDLGTNPLFRSFAPTASAHRVLPRLADILNGTVNAKAETLPTESRTLNFRLTASDAKGGVDSDDMRVIVDGNSGPFKVLQPDTSVTLDSMQSQVIEWNAACSDQSPVNCNTVDILLSTDGGLSYPNVLSAATPNDGVESVSFASVTSASQARIRVQCSGNIFFDISDSNFQISNGTGSVLVATGNGGSYNCGTASVGGDNEPNNIPLDASLITLPITIKGTVNDASDKDDYFLVVGNGKTYNFSLSGYGSHDLDLYLYDDILNELSASNSSTASTENVRADLTSGSVYYVRVKAFDTSTQTTPYTLTITTSGGGGGGGGFDPVCLLLLFLGGLIRLRLYPHA